MNSEPVAPHGYFARILVPLYVIVTTCTVGAALYLAFAAIAVASRSDWRGYCYHGGGGELIAYGVAFGLPVVALQVLLSLFVTKTIRRSIVVTAAAMLPAVLLLGRAPCF